MPSSWLGEGGTKCSGCVEKSSQELPPTQQPKAMKTSMKMSEKPKNPEVNPCNQDWTEHSWGPWSVPASGSTSITAKEHHETPREHIPG